MRKGVNKAPTCLHQRSKAVFRLFFFVFWSKISDTSNTATNRVNLLETNIVRTTFSKWLTSHPGQNELSSKSSGGSISGVIFKDENLHFFGSSVCVVCASNFRVDSLADTWYFYTWWATVYRNISFTLFLAASKFAGICIDISRTK